MLVHSGYCESFVLSQPTVSRKSSMSIKVPGFGFRASSDSVIACVVLCNVLGGVAMYAVLWRCVS